MESETKYLTYTPWLGQLNNTRMCFETSLVLAYLTGRCLVVPKAYRRHDEPEWDKGIFRSLHPQEIFELESLDGIVPLLSQEQYDQTQTKSSEDRFDLTFDPHTAVFCYPEIPAAGSREADRLLEFAVTRRRFLEITPSMKACRTLNVKSPTLEHFYSFFYFSQLQDEVACKRLVRDHVRFKNTIIETANRIAMTLGSYGALHVRRNDFFRQYPRQNIPVDRLLSNVMSVVPAPDRLYIASDERDRKFFSQIRDHYEVYFIDDFRGILPENLSEESIACVEQMICAFAKVFVGTKLSTFSGYITRLRGYHGAHDKRIYFTDGSPGSDMDDQGAPLFSWKNWLQRGSPIWGREFKEGWEF